MKKTVLNKRLPAFTLTELMVVLVIIGILVLLALPKLMPLISQAKSTEAKLQLSHVYKLEKTYFMQYSKYSNNLEEIGFEQEKLSTSGGNANYQIDIKSASTTEFIATATAIVDFDADGNINTWEINQDNKLTETKKD